MMNAGTGSVLQLETSGSYKSTWFQRYYLHCEIRNLAKLKSKSTYVIAFVNLFKTIQTPKIESTEHSVFSFQMF